MAAASVDEVAQELISKYDNVTLIANNHSLTDQDIDSIPSSERDAVIHFNRCAFLHRFFAKDNFNIVFLTKDGNSPRFHGFPIYPDLFRLMTIDPDRYHLVFCMMRQQAGVVIPRTSPIRSSVAITDAIVPLDDYASDRELRPSSGFLALKLLHAGRPNTLALGSTIEPNSVIPEPPPLSHPAPNAAVGTDGSRFPNLSVCGFFDVEGGSFWSGHAWDYERAWVAARGIPDRAAEAGSGRSGAKTPGAPARRHRVEVVYDNDAVQVLHHPGLSDFALFLFNEQSVLAGERRFWGQDVVMKAGIRAVAFMTKRPDWFPSGPTLSAIRALAPALPKVRPRIAFGHGMGAYGAIKFSRALDIDTVVAFSPQHSILSDEVGSHTQLSHHATPANVGMAIKADDISGRVFLFYDPLLAFYKYHAETIAQFGGVTPIPMRHTGYAAIKCFSGWVDATRLLRACHHGTVDEVRAIAAERRKAFSDRGHNVALAAIRRHPNWALRILTASVAHMSADAIGKAYATLGASFFHRGRTEEARRCIEEAIRSNPHDADHAKQFSLFFLYTRHLPEALDWANRAVGLAPHDADFIAHRDAVAARAAASQ